MTTGTTGYFSDNRRKLGKHEVQRRKLDRRDKKLLKMQERVEMRKRPTGEHAQEDKNR